MTTVETASGSSRRVRLMLTCLCDAFYGEVGIATVRVLEAAGCEVLFDDAQTCCGQPPFNAGDWAASRRVAEHAKHVLLRGEEPVVAPSGSCTAMMREGYPMLWPGSEHPRAFELSEFLVHHLGVTAWPPTGAPREYRRKVAFHGACHGRSIGLRDEQRTLLGGIPGIEFVDFAQSEQCCGFGGAFSATHGAVSAGIGIEKLRNMQAAGAEEIVSGDMGCLMQLDGLIRRYAFPMRARHFAEILAEVLP